MPPRPRAEPRSGTAIPTGNTGTLIWKWDVSTCNNPTFIAGQPTRNYLAEIAPQPPDCDKVGQGPCVDTGGRPSGLQNPGQGGVPANPSAGPSRSAGGAGGGGAGGKGSAAGGATGKGSASGAGATGKGSAGGTGTTGPGSATGSGQGSSGPAGEASSSATPGRTSVADTPLAVIPCRSAGVSRLLAPLSVALLLIALVAPPVLFLAFARRPKEDA